MRELTIYRRRETLNKMTQELDLRNVYGSTIKRIAAQDGGKWRLGMAALMWISYAERPLRVDELCHALAVELGSTDFNAGNVPSISTVVGCCQGLISVDEETSTVRLINLTLQEYLFSSPGIFLVCEPRFCEPHSEMAEICLTYLKSNRVKALVVSASPDAGGAPFLEYCSVYWGVHAKKGPSDYTTPLALDLFQEYDGHISPKLLFKQVEHLDDLDTHFSAGFQFTGLHCASFFGIGEVVAALLEMKYYDVNARDFVGYTPLAWAALNGHAEVLRMLLGHGEVKPYTPDNHGRTPLSHAACNGNVAAVKMLLRRDVTPDKPDNGGRTPLSLAAEGGHDEVVKLLLGLQAVSLDKPDNHGYIPLSHSAWNGNEGVVKILLGREEVDPENQDDEGRTSLSYAAGKGHQGVVKILLGREEIHSDMPDNAGRTPLSHAAGNGHEEVVEMLLDRAEVYSEMPDDAGRTPLSYAAGKGHEEAVRILLGRPEVNPDRLDNTGKTSLSHAAKNGHAGVVKMLLSRKEVTSNRPDHFGRTPLMLAEMYSHKAVVEVLKLHEFAEVHSGRGSSSGNICRVGTTHCQLGKARRTQPGG